MVSTVSRGGEGKLAIRIGGGGPQPTGQSLSRLLASSGCLISSGRAEAWRIEAAEETSGGTLFLGPAFEGRSLDELCRPEASGSKPGGEAGLAALAAAARALATAAKLRALPSGLLSSGILVGAGDAVLILPPEPVRRAFRALGAEARRGAAAFLGSPRAEGAEAEAAFLLAQAVYRAASGRSAYPGGEEGRELAAGGFLPLAQLCPRLDPALSRAVDAALAAPEAASLGRLVEALAQAAAQGWRRELSAEEERALERRLASASARLESRRRREAFLRKRGAWLIGAGIGLALVLAVGLSFLEARRGKPSYAALPPLELARAYYRAVDAMDLDSVEACAEGEAAKVDRDYLSTMTVVSKMRQAYEGRNPIVKAEAWLAEGRPELAPDKLLFGITGLSLAELSAEGEKALLRAEYSSWALDRSEKAEAEAEGREGDGPAAVIERRLSDELRLERRGAKGWKIVAIERAER